MKSHKRHLVTTGVVLFVLALGAGVFVWSGMYNIGADEPHWMPTRVLIDNLRERSIASRMADAPVPDLDAPGRITAGARNYSAMCTGCHLAPGVDDTEIRPGLYPTPPDLSKLGAKDSKRAFWIIKHGIKMTAMPAWGKTHTDEQIWNMVAFIRKLPGMTPAQYAALGGKPPAEDDDHMHAGMEDAHASEHPGVEGHAHPDGHEHAPAGSPAPGADVMDGMVAGSAPEAEAVAKAFQRALQRGDRDAVLALLTPGVQISEGGNSQSRTQYAAGHLAEDIAFLKQAQVKPLALGSMSMLGTAMVGSRSEIVAVHEGQPVVLISSELLTLVKSGATWKIAKVQWSSQQPSRAPTH